MSAFVLIDCPYVAQYCQMSADWFHLSQFSDKLDIVMSYITVVHCFDLAGFSVAFGHYYSITA